MMYDVTLMAYMISMINDATDMHYDDEYDMMRLYVICMSMCVVSFIKFAAHASQPTFSRTSVEKLQVVGKATHR